MAGPQDPRVSSDGSVATDQDMIKTGSESCEDKLAGCGSGDYEKEDCNAYGEDYSKWMRETCPKTCGLCGDDGTFNPIEKPTNCVFPFWSNNNKYTKCTTKSMEHNGTSHMHLVLGSRTQDIIITKANIRSWELAL